MPSYKVKVVFFFLLPSLLIVGCEQDVSSPDEAHKLTPPIEGTSKTRAPAPTATLNPSSTPTSTATPKQSPSVRPTPPSKSPSVRPTPPRKTSSDSPRLRYECRTVLRPGPYNPSMPWGSSWVPLQECEYRSY